MGVIARFRRSNPMMGIAVSRSLVMDNWIWDRFVAELNLMIDAFDRYGLDW